MMPKFTIIRHFNSHAHVERDTLGKIDTAMIGISTHTLTWSVTFNLFYDRLNLVISTHTLTWSVTDNLPELVKAGMISTHTLTWSVT